LPADHVIPPGAIKVFSNGWVSKKKDDLHRLVAGKYLKQLLQGHQVEGTLDITKENLAILCKKCSLPELCNEWDSINKLTCFCLESVLPYKS
jgi:hypothetical protein